MASTITALTGGGGVAVAGDTSGVLELKTNNGTTAMTIDTAQNTSFVGSINSLNTFGFKNRIINGAMGIWQRGTSFTPVASTIVYTADRWWVNRATTSALTVTQVTGTNNIYAIKIQRNSGDTTTNVVYFGQAIETNNCKDLAGQNVAISVALKVGANFSGGTITVVTNTGSGTDQGAAGQVGGSWTSFANQTAMTITPTTSLVTYTGTVTIPAGTNEVGIRFSWTPSGTAGADDSVTIESVQLEKGSTATSFDYRPYGTELQLCQRYFEKSYNQSTAIGTACTLADEQLCIYPAASIASTYSWGKVKFSVTKRAAPTITTYGKNGTSTVANNDAGTNFAANSAVANNISDNGFEFQNSSGGALTLTYGTIYSAWAASAEL